jgi:putative GTP pyrophosphokinase
MASEDKGAIPDPPASAEARFDFAGHGADAVERYLPVQALYEEFAETLCSILRVALREEQIKVQAIEPRAKSVDSFREKAERPHEADANRPKYPDPLAGMAGITDLAGVRVVVFLENSVTEVSNLVHKAFDVLEVRPVDAPSGYRSLHLTVALRDDRDQLLEYKRFVGCLAEIQVRTVLQHAWGEVEHGIGYKASVPPPDPIRRELKDLSGSLAGADRVLQRLTLEVASGRKTESAIADPAPSSPSPGGGEHGVGEATASDAPKDGGESPKVS